MKFRIKSSDGEKEWWEDYDEAIDDPDKWAKETLRQFNNDLKSYEKPRTLLAVEILDRVNTHHDWVKRTDGMSVIVRGECVDLMFCSRCKVTGKRHGLSVAVKRDAKWRAKKYERCQEAPDGQ